MKNWKKGAILGFLFIPLWFLVSAFLMIIAILFNSETLGGIVDVVFFMVVIVPPFTILKRFKIMSGSLLGSTILIPIFFWTLIGALIGYLVDKQKLSKVTNIGGD